jgi:hypothetical protein
VLLSDDYSLARGEVFYIVADFHNNAAEFMAHSDGVFTSPRASE